MKICQFARMLLRASVKNMSRPLMSSLQAHAITRSQRGATMVEFVIVGPVISFIGLAAIQYALMFSAHNMMNQASFMAARAGSMGNAKMSAIQSAYIKALIPLYGGGTSSTELAESYARALADTALSLQIRLKNPTTNSFDDYATDTALNQKYGARAIHNSGQMQASTASIGAKSGQNLQDANLLKLQIVQGYMPKVPLVGSVYTLYLKWTDPKTDPFYTAQVEAGRIPITSDVTVQMQSDPVEDVQVSSSTGDTGTPSDGAETPDDPADCATMGCTVTNPTAPTAPTAPGDGGVLPTGPSCSATPTSVTSATVSADVLFAFGQSTLTVAGKQQLDQAIAQAKDDTSITAISITGYTDQIGSASVNQQLSTDRANAVKNYLQSNGLGAIPITAIGAGSSNPVTAFSSCPASGQAQIDCLAANRRVVIGITRKTT